MLMLLLDVQVPGPPQALADQRPSPGVVCSTVVGAAGAAPVCAAGGLGSLALGTAAQ